MKPRALILRCAGVNCDEETAFAFESAGAATRRIHVNRILENHAILDEFSIVAFPGGFSYGDDLGAGRILGLEVRTALADSLLRFRDRGGLTIGICNGFQVLVQAGLLPGPDRTGRLVPATLAQNDSGRYEDRWVTLRARGGLCRFIDQERTITLPVAHGEGKFIVPGAGAIDALERAGQAVLTYVTKDGGPPGYPENPNGSMGHVAGICDGTGQVFGLMPHPERFLFPYQHPRHTRGEAGQVGDGLEFFKTAVANSR
jgi:phosphoribosylformylglycinamidine synthase